MVTLEQLFQHQDAVSQAHLSQSQYLWEVFSLISDSVQLNLKVLMTFAFPQEKQTAIRRLACDSLSHTIVAVRLGLWGNLPEGLTILRSALESAVQLLFVVREQKYKTAVYEMQNRFKQISYKAALIGLGDLGSNANKIHGKLSEIAAHATAKRMALVDYNYEGDYYDRVGFARNAQWAERALFYCMDTSVMVTQSFFIAMEQDGLQVSWLAEKDDLVGRFQSLKRKPIEKWNDEQSGKGATSRTIGETVAGGN